MHRHRRCVVRGVLGATCWGVASEARADGLPVNVNAATAVAQNADGRLEVAWLNPLAGAVVHRWQLWPGGPWGPLEPLGVSPPGASHPVLARNGVGRLEAFVDTPEGTWNIWQVAPNGGWSDWTLTAEGFHRPAVVRKFGADGRLEAFFFDSVRGAFISHAWQTTPAMGPWSGVTQL